MNRVNQTPLFDTTAAKYVLGVLMWNPSIIYNEEDFTLTTDDFSIDIYAIIFSIIYNLSQAGVSKITPQDIELYLNQYPTMYDKYTESDGSELCRLIYEVSAEYDTAKFKLYYDKIKKLTILRDLKSFGFNIKEFYDEDADFLNRDEVEKKLNETPVEQLFDTIRKGLDLIESRNVVKINAEAQNAAKGLRELVEELKENPEIGVPMDGDIVTYATRGCRKGKLFLYSGNTGGGKTRTMVGIACGLAYPKIIDGKIVKRKKLEKVVYMPTEQEVDEIQTLILANVSGVNERKIIFGSYTKEEQSRINKAIELIEEYSDNLIIDKAKDTSIKGIKSKILNHIYKGEVEYFFYDYIFSSVGLIQEFQQLRLREDVVLMMLTNTLKEIAANYNVFMMSGTQLAGDYNKKVHRDMSYLRGSKAIADKIDIGMIGIPIPPEELEEIKEYIEELGLDMPNIVIDFYKNRRGEIAHAKLFRKFDYSTCRAKDILITNLEYVPITDIQRIMYDTEIIGGMDD